MGCAITMVLWTVFDTKMMVCGHHCSYECVLDVSQMCHGQYHGLFCYDNIVDRF